MSSSKQILAYDDGDGGVLSHAKTEKAAADAVNAVVIEATGHDHDRTSHSNRSEEAATTESLKPLTIVESQAILSWLSFIEETDPEIIRSVLGKCAADEDARAYFLRRATEVPAVSDSDLRCCTDCRNLTPLGLCLAARRGELGTAKQYSPVADVPRRCYAYLPGPEDMDRRPGRSRWPTLAPQREV
jgi:hypothetical protein